MNLFQSQMASDISFHKSLKEQNARQKEVEAIIGEKFSDVFKVQVGFPKEKAKCTT